MSNPRTVLLIGGTGPTGPAIARGLERRGFDVTILHSGTHEVAEVAHLRHLHGDVFSHDGLRHVLGGEDFDVAIAGYGRLRSIAEVLDGRVGRLLSIGGAPVYRGFFEPAVHQPAGLPVPVGEDAELANEDDDGKSYRIGRTEQMLFEWHPTATHFRYPYVYGPRQLAPREWCVIRRILDRRPFLVLPDDGLSLIPFGYVDNLAHAILLAVDQPEASMGEIFNCGDDEKLTIRQVAEIITDELDHDWELVSMPARFTVPARPLMMNYRTTHRVLDTSKLRELLGYRDVVPARDAVRRATRWLVANPPLEGGYEESALQDPFDYGAEDRLVAWWRAAIAELPDLGYAQEPGYGKSYAGPGTRNVRADTDLSKSHELHGAPMTLHGWSLPLSPGGAAALVPPPPWHFSGEAIGVDYRGDPDALAAVLPAFDVAGRGRLATFVFVDWCSAADADPRIALDPARGQYREAYVVVQATLDGARVARVPYIWVDNDLSFARGHIQGFPKKLGEIALSRPVSLGRGGPRLSIGETLVGHVSSLGRRLARASVTLEARAAEGYIPKAMRLPIWHTRHVPDLAGGPPLVHDLARNVLDGFACADVWTGAATLGFGASEFEELDALAPVEILGGFRCSIAFTITGAETRPA